MEAWFDSVVSLLVDARTSRIVLVLSILGLFSACDGRPAHNPETDSRVELGGWLYACSPFISFDGQKMMTFSADGRVSLDQQKPGSEEQAEGILAAKAKDAITTKGTWIGEERPNVSPYLSKLHFSTIRLHLGEDESNYVFITTADEGICML